MNMGAWVAWIDRFTLGLGRLNSWVILGMVVGTALVAVLRYLFNLGWVWMQDLMIYLHALFFLGAVSFGLLRGGHVRVDLWYHTASPKAQARVDLLGCLGLLVPFCLLILYQSFPYVAASWSVFEGSSETGGMPGVFLLKSLLLLFPVTLLLQGLSQSLKAILVLREG